MRALFHYAGPFSLKRRVGFVNSLIKYIVCDSNVAQVPALKDGHFSRVVHAIRQAVSKMQRAAPPSSKVERVYRQCEEFWRLPYRQFFPVQFGY